MSSRLQPRPIDDFRPMLEKFYPLSCTFAGASAENFALRTSPHFARRKRNGGAESAEAVLHTDPVQHSRAGNRRIAARVVDDDDQVDNFLRDDLTPRLLDRPLCVVCGMTTTTFFPRIILPVCSFGSAMGRKAAQYNKSHQQREPTKGLWYNRRSALSQLSERNR